MVNDKFSHPMYHTLQIVNSPYHRNFLQQGAQKCDRFWFIHFLSCRINPIRNQLETVLDFWLVNVCTRDCCELIKGDHTFGLLCVKKYMPIYNLRFALKKGKAEKQVLRNPR